MTIIGQKLRRIEYLARKVFCPTGPGGGVDPTCGSGGGSGGEDEWKNALRFDGEEMQDFGGEGRVEHWYDFSVRFLRAETKKLGLSDTQKKSVVDYRKAVKGKWVNDFLRGNQQESDFFRETLKEMDSVFEKDAASVSRSIVAFRGVSKSRLAKIKAGGEGYVFTDSGFVSTSLSPRDAKAFSGGGSSSVIEVRVPKGSKAIGLDNALPPGGANELLLDRSSKFKVVGTSDSGRLIVEYLGSGGSGKSVSHRVGGRRFLWD